MGSVIGRHDTRRDRRQHLAHRCTHSIRHDDRVRRSLGDAVGRHRALGRKPHSGRRRWKVDARTTLGVGDEHDRGRIRDSVEGREHRVSDEWLAREVDEHLGGVRIAGRLDRIRRARGRFGRRSGRMNDRCTRYGEKNGEREEFHACGCAIPATHDRR